MKTILREPLLHFLAIGALLFGIYSSVNVDAPSQEGKKIVVSTGDIERLAINWSKSWNRQPTEAELKGLVGSYIKDEVYYREALALGLDQDDTVLRRRLVQKMEFLSNDLADLNNPDEEALNQYMMANSEKYELPARISFTHVYFSADKHGDLLDVVDKALTRLREGKLSTSRATDLGDSLMLPYSYTLETPFEVSRLFGKQFAVELFQAETGRWHGPITSGYGVHLINISDKVEATLPELASVIDKVRTDYLFEQRQKTNKAIYERFKERYEIVIEEIPTLKGEGATESSSGSSS